MSVSNPAKMEARLPSTVEAIRDGWQQTSQGGAVVSGLLAAVAAQLLSYFRDSGTYTRSGISGSQGARDVVVALCYGALFFNIGATISAFIIIDKLGSLTLVYARKNPISVGTFGGTEAEILEYHGAGSKWNYILWHWIICFYSGTVCLAVLLLTFIWLQESYWIGGVISVIAGCALIPSLFILIFVKSDKEASLDEESSLASSSTINQPSQAPNPLYAPININSTPTRDGGTSQRVPR